MPEIRGRTHGLLPFRTIFILWLMLYVSRHQRLSSSRTGTCEFPFSSTSPLSSGNSGGVFHRCRLLARRCHRCLSYSRAFAATVPATSAFVHKEPRRNPEKLRGSVDQECYYIIWYVNLSAVLGLAAMLAHICKTGYDLREVCHGRVLADWVDSTFRDLLANVQCSSSRPSRSAVTKDAGQSCRIRPWICPRRYLSGHDSTSAGGIVYDLDDSTLSVLPEPLRCVSVHDHFFRGPVPLPLDRLLEAAPCLGAACKTLVGAKCEGLLSRHVNFWGCSTKPTTDVHGNSSCGAMRRMLVWCLITVPI